MHAFRIQFCLAFALSATLIHHSPTVTEAADAASTAPATVTEAAKVLDLAAIPLVAKAEPPKHRGLASLSYDAPGTTKEVFDFHRKQLTGQKWKELPNGYVSDQAASGSFTRDGYSLSLTVYPMGKAGQVSVMLTNHGNVDLAKLPIPPGVKPFFGGPVNAAYLTEVPVEQTADACRKLFLAKGWEPYGSAGDVAYYKNNAVRLAVRVSAAPAQGGKTVIDYSTALMSVDLPAPAETINLQYADITRQLSFDSQAAEEDIVGFYRRTLAKPGWAATTEKPIKIGFKDVMIFRNPQKDLLTLEMMGVEGKTRVSLKHQSAAEVAEIDQKIKAEMDRKKQEKDAPLPKLALALPADAKDIKQTKNRIEFQMANGKAKAVVAAWQKKLANDGWKAEVSTLEDMAGAISLKKGGQGLSVMYSDTGFLPAEITVRASGVELEQAAEKP